MRKKIMEFKTPGMVLDQLGKLEQRIKMLEDRVREILEKQEKKKEYNPNPDAWKSEWHEAKLKQEYQRGYDDGVKAERLTRSDLIY